MKLPNLSDLLIGKNWIVAFRFLKCESWNYPDTLWNSIVLESALTNTSYPKIDSTKTFIGKH